MSRAREIEERAALWVLRREEPYWSAEEQAELDAWLGESDSHKAAFWRLEHGWREADRIASLGDSPRAYQPRLIAWWKPLAVAASVLLVFTVFTLRGPGLPLVGPEQVQAIEFQTAVGGHKIVDLSDGSRVELNTDSAIEARDLRTGRLRPDVWERWLAWDPVRMAPAHADDLRSMRAIWIDAGRSDDFYLDLGAEAFRDELEKLGVTDAVRFELFDGTHANIEWRYPSALRFLAERLAP